MFVPFIYAIVVLWASLFNPQVIDMIPVGDHNAKALLYMIAVVSLWCILAVSSLDSRSYD